MEQITTSVCKYARVYVRVILGFQWEFTFIAGVSEKGKDVDSAFGGLITIIHSLH